MLRSKGNISVNSSRKCSGISRSRGQNDINSQSQSRRILWNSVFLIWHDHCIFKVTIAASGCTRPAKYQRESFPAWIQNGLQKKKKPSRKQLATDCCYWIGVSFFWVWLVLGYQYSISSLSMCLTAEIVRISLSQRKRLWSWEGDMAEWWGEVERRCRYRQMQLNKIIERSIPICLAVNVQHYTNSMISLEVYFLFLWCFLFWLFAFVFILLTALYF